ARYTQGSERQEGNQISGLCFLEELGSFHHIYLSHYYTWKVTKVLAINKSQESLERYVEYLWRKNLEFLHVKGLPHLRRNMSE
ncbi:hypothetical protein HMI54_012981, partial [Coelomomyces lativittatus]